MNLLPLSVANGLGQVIGQRFVATRLSGGDVNQAALVTAGSSRLVVKWKDNAPAGLFDAEADGLNRLKSAGSLRVPEVIAFDDNSEPSWLAMEYIAASSGGNSSEFGRTFGEGLARLHQSSGSLNGQFGLNRSNYLGSQLQNNEWTATWHEFYRDHRLLPQINRAAQSGMLNVQRARVLDQVMEKTESLLSDFKPRPVLIHGDLWSGNFLNDGNGAVLIDPAVYYAEREVEIAYTELFGGFPSGFHASYQASFPLDSGYERRRSLHQLYPLLIHLNHFGETYGPAVDQACQNALRQYG